MNTAATDPNPQPRGVAPYDAIYPDGQQPHPRPSNPPPVPPRPRPAPITPIPSLAEVEPEEVRWLWPGRIPYGKLTVLDGNPNVGKSTLSIDIAARLTTGRSMPDQTDPTEPADVLILNVEDGQADTIRPRAEAAGANLNRIRVLHTCPYTSEDGIPRTRPFQIPRDLGHLRNQIGLHGARLVVIDVLNQFIGRASDTYKDQDMRAALGPLVDLAATTGVAVLALRHLTKGHRDNANAMFSGSGTVAIIGIARSGLVAVPHPTEPDNYALALTKNNLSRRPDTLQYRLVDAPDHKCARIQWGDTLELTADELLIPAGQTKGGQAQDLIRERLANGPIPSTELRQAAHDREISDRTLKRAKQDLGTKSTRQGYGPDGQWHTQLPDT